MRVVGWIATGLVAGVVIGIAVAGAASAPDVKRYLRIRGMQAMHEAGYCHGVLHAVEGRAAGRPVARIGVRVGSLHRILPAAFEQSFQMMAAGGVADGAATELTVVPARGSCAGCGRDFSTNDPPVACPHCGSFDVRADGGDELVLEWVEYRAAGG